MQDAKRGNTKSALISAAERLFAEKGLGGVSVREITRAAGARNESALHYHFGGMDALITEVFVHRYREIEKARQAHLAEMDRDQKSRDIETLMDAAVRPLFEACLEEDGRLYARFCVQLTADPRFNVNALVRDTAMESATTIRDRAFDALTDLPESTLNTRMRRLFTISIILMADYARSIELGSALPVEEAIAEASASLSGFLRARPAQNSD